MNTLWTKNFTIITLGTVISAIGATAMNLVLSFVVFDQTKSTFLSGAFGAISIIPSLILPLISSVWLDRFPRKPVIVKIDFLNGCLYFLFGLFSLVNGFQYMTYLLFSFIILIHSDCNEFYISNCLPKSLSTFDSFWFRPKRLYYFKYDISNGYHYRFSNCKLSLYKNRNHSDFLYLFVAIMDS